MDKAKIKIQCETEGFGLKQYEDTELKKGKWKEHIFDGIMGDRPRALMCTRCNYISLCVYNYCPNCGADMRATK